MNDTSCMKWYWRHDMHMGLPVYVYDLTKEPLDSFGYAIGIYHFITFNFPAIGSTNMTQTCGVGLTLAPLAV